MDFNLKEVMSNVSEILKRYDNGDVKTTEAVGIMILESNKAYDYLANNFDNLSDKERMSILIVIYSINETMIKMFEEFNNKLDDYTDGFLSKRKDILTFDFSWDKED